MSPILPPPKATRPVLPRPAHAPGDAALTAGFQRALLVCVVFLLAAAVIALRATNSRGEPATEPRGIPAARDQVPAAEPAD